ncbi:Esterase FE4 [Eumeta japonica]|uniref:Esterase FE4 n=1 Tax=Eumeta variegata TaxID=151549 RepID=A0A4C1T2K1_EUMVA|nr:Esterase FE4 [Eumeta japonica]
MAPNRRAQTPNDHENGAIAGESLRCEGSANLIVNTKFGKVQGTEQRTIINNVDYYAFWGIPYAVPPVGNMRFLSPVPHEGWSDTLIADKEKEPCVQLNHNARKGPLLHRYGKEDCLYLNVFAPDFDRESDTKNPVIVFIYNEQFRNSYNSSQYGPDFFIEQSVIVVQIHHRLSVFGFISAEDEILPGNAGLRDILLSLKWIQNNIALFGGDSKKVTLMGVQGGAVAVELLLNTKEAEGLFHAAILQSGTSFSSMYLQTEPRRRAFRLAEKVNRASSSTKSLLKNLNDATAEELMIKELTALPDEYSLTEQKGLLAFGPVVEKDNEGLLAEYPENIVDRLNVPIMVGFNSREGIDGALTYLNEPRYLSFAEKYFRLHLPIRTGYKFDPNDDAYLKAIGEVKRFYFSNGRIKVRRPAEYVTYIGDVVSMYPIDYAIKKYAEYSLSPIFYYHFDYAGVLNENKKKSLNISTVSDGTWGAVTGDELCYLFVCPKLKEQYVKLNELDSDDILVQRNLVRVWANFAKHGDPTPDEDTGIEFKWLPYKKETNKYLHITNTMEIKENLYARRFKFWDELINKWRDDIIVNTNSGKVAGKRVKSILENQEYYSFLGIPYAEPPIGERRFLAPIPHEGWPEILECKKERPACSQNFLPVRQFPRYGYFGSEDCLHLSIHTPRLSPQEPLNLPTVVFIYNEQFRLSYNGSKDYSPDFFMEQDVIVVSVNHRLGALGFLSYEDDLLPGNNGLRDVILALQWLKSNIKYFGGDSDRITLMGNQGGSVLVDMLLFAPKAKGLFHRAILQSGTSWNSLYFSGGSRDKALKLAEEAEMPSGTSKDLLSNLQKVPAFNLTVLEPNVIHADESRAIQRGGMAFSPIVEHEHPDAIITKLPEESSIDIDIPIMIGYNSREGIELVERFLRKPQYLTFADRDFLLLFPIRTNYHFEINHAIYYDAVQEVKDFYFDEGYVKISRPGEYMTYVADIMQFYSVDYTVRKYANESKAPVYYYTFDYDGEFNARKKFNLKDAINYDGTWGASVTDELCYLFVCNSLRKTYAKALKAEDSEEISVLKNMVKLWTDFIKTGNPTPTKDGHDNFVWTPVTKNDKHCLLINEEMQMKTNLHQNRVDFWNDFIQKYKEMAVDGVIKDQKDEL